MTGKTDKQFLFQVQLNLLAGSKGILSANDADGVLHIATPPVFGGEGKPWSAEHLFLGSLAGSFMSTYLAFAKKLQFVIAHFECDTIGQIEIIEGKYKFTHINLYPKVYIAEEVFREKANRAMVKTHKNCLVANSLDAIIFYHSEVLIYPQA